MFIKKFLKPNKVDDVNTAGQFIKVMNCEGVVRMRVTFQGEIVLESDVRAGFDVRTSTPFDLIQITSETEQKLELWVSKHKLSYDALSTKASRSNSFIVEHYGASQSIIGYDPSQSSAKVVCSEKPIWVGGEGVNKENGIPVLRGDTYSHNSAAPLYAYVDEYPEYKAQTASMEEFGLGSYGGNESNIKGVHVAQNGDVAMTLDSEERIWFITNTKTLEVIKGSEALNPSSRPTMFKDGFICKTESVGNDVAYIKPDGSIEIIYIAFDDIIDARVLAGFDGGVYFFGVQKSGIDKVLRLNNDLSVDVLTVTLPVASTSISSSANVDPYTGNIWVQFGEYGVGYFDESIENFTVIMPNIYGDGERVLTAFNFNENAVYFGAAGTWFLLNRNKGYEVKKISAKGFYVSADLNQIIVIKNREVLESNNGGDTFLTVQTFNYDLNFNSATQEINSFTGENGVFFVVEKDSGEGFCLRIPFYIDKAEPKASIRVFKESF